MQHRFAVAVRLAGHDASAEGFTGIALAVAALVVGANHLAVRGIGGIGEAVLARVGRRRRLATTHLVAMRGIVSAVEAVLAGVGRRRRHARVDAGFERFAERIAAVGATSS